MKQINLSKTLLLLALLLINTMVRAAESNAGTIQGRVTTTDDKPAAFVTVSITGLNKANRTDDDGAYSLHNIKPGTYTLKVSFIGLATQTKTVEVLPGKTLFVDFKLAETSATLNEVTINARKTINSTKLSLNKAGISPLDMPQSGGVVSSQVLQDQQVNRLGDAVRNVSGVTLTQTRGGVGETFTARGYSIGIGGGAGSIFKNGVLVNTAGFPEASTLESVEILKGSSALLYGNVSGGLIINMVTKKPKFENGGVVSMRAGSFNEFKPTVDVYGPLSNNVAYRAVATYENDGSYRSHVKTERFYANPSVLYNLGKNTTLTVEGDFLRSNLTPDWGVGSLNNGQAIPTMVARDQFINTAWAYSHMNQYTGSLTLDHHLNEDWKLNFITSAQGTHIDSYGSTQPSTVNLNGDWNRTLARANTHEGDYTVQSNLTGKFTTGSISHQLLVGMDAAEVDNVSYAYTINGLPIASYAYDKINTINLSQYAQRTDIPDAIAATRTAAPVYRAGTYVQDLISLTAKFKVLAGLRWSTQHTSQTNIDSIQKNKSITGAAGTRNDQAFSPKVALIYQPITTTSIYVDYSNNFMVNSGTDVNTRQGLAPSLVDQYEAGIKNELFDGKLSANVSIYRIVNSNLAVLSPYGYDGVTPNTDATLKKFSGQTTSDGLEIDLTGHLTNNLYFITGYAYNHAYFSNTTGLKGSNLEGEPLVINPSHTANASLFYTIDKGKLRGVKLGASSFYTGFRYAGYNNTVQQAQAYNRLLPVGGFATLDLSAGYTYKKLSLLSSITNVTNTMNYLVHDNYSVTPIPPTQFVTTLAYKF